MCRIPVLSARLLAAGLLLSSGGCVSFGRPAPAAHPRIADLRANPNPARAGESVMITFTAWDAGGGRGGEWIASLRETPEAGGRLEGEGGVGLRTSPKGCETRYVTQAPTEARIDVQLTAYGDCEGVLCVPPSDTVTASVDVTVLER